jgi:hypothetical protein
VSADEGGEYLDDRRLVVGGVGHDALQRIDRSDAYVGPRRAGLAELLHCPGEAVGDLSLRGDPDLVRGDPHLLGREQQRAQRGECGDGAGQGRDRLTPVWAGSFHERRVGTAGA